MIDVVNKKCNKCGIKNPVFNYEGEKKGIFCFDCKDFSMINVVDNKCNTCMKKTPTFNYIGLSPLFCVECKEPDMIDVVNKKCIKCNIKRPTFNYIGELYPSFCIECKDENMINVKDKKCITCNTKRPFYNFKNEAARFCSDCKKPGMVNINYKLCSIDQCTSGAIYSFVGVSPLFCRIHSKNGMILKPRRKCIGTDDKICNDVALFGIHEPQHCINHRIENETDFSEHPCIKCGKNDILNKEGICINYCNLEIINKSIKIIHKKKEDAINRLLDIKIEMKPYTTDTIIDTACSKYRPDRVYHCGTHVIIIEIDENQHKSYSNCGITKDEKIKGEIRRMFSIAQSFDGLSVIFLRYNPDIFYDNTGKKVNILISKRRDILLKWINNCLTYDVILHTGYKVKYLFYDGYIETDNTFTTFDVNDVI